MNPLMKTFCQRAVRQISHRSSWVNHRRVNGLPCTASSAALNFKSNSTQNHFFSTAAEPETAIESSSISNLKPAPSPVESVPSSEAIATPTADGEEKVFSPKIVEIVDSIANLTLGEVTDLNEALKKRLNLPDVAAFPMGAAMAMPAAGAAEQTEESEDFGAPKKTSFNVKLLSFSDDKKIALIKEIKNNVAGYNLVQAKKFVESLPQVVKYDMAKDEAEKMVELMEAAGGKCEIE